MDLDSIYKTRLPESHEAGLTAVFDAGLAHAASAFVASVPTEPTQVVPTEPPAPETLVQTDQVPSAGA